MASHRQIKQGRAADDGHSGKAHIKADPLLLQIFHYPGSGIQPESASSAENHGVSHIAHVARLDGFRFSAGRGASPNVHAGDGSFWTKDHRAAGSTLFIPGLSDPDPLYLMDPDFRFLSPGFPWAFPALTHKAHSLLSMGQSPLPIQMPLEEGCFSSLLPFIFHFRGF